jgi:uncharacterized protein YacL
MTRQKNKSFDNVNRLKKVIVVIGILVTLFGGMLAAIVAIDNFKNYESPYLFGFVFGTIGLLIGLLIAIKLKQKIIINRQMQQNYYKAIMFIATGFMGMFMLLGQQANTIFSTKEKCDNYFVVDKIFRKSGHKQREINIIVINIDGVLHKINTNHNYWQTVPVGQQIMTCIYKSKIGFDYLSLPNEN